MIWKTPCPAEEGGAYPCCLGVKAGLHSEAYWLRLGPVWTNKAAVWSHLTTAPEAYQETLFFSCVFLQATTSTSATEAQTSCALLCICVSDRSGFRQMAGDGDTEKKSFWFKISRLRFHAISRPFCWFVQTSVSAQLYLADLGIGLPSTGWKLKVAVEKGKLEAAEYCTATFNQAKWRIFCRHRQILINGPEVQIREHRAKEKKDFFCDTLAGYMTRLGLYDGYTL